MYIQNENGIFNVNAAHYNWLMATFNFYEINSEIVSKTGFVNSSSEYKRATELAKSNKDWLSKLK